MPDAESAEGITTGFRAVWNKPPRHWSCSRSARTTSRKFGSSSGRSPSICSPYVAMIAARQRRAAGAPTEETPRPFLSAVYMHVRSWTLMREFICEGGSIRALELFLHDNEYLRAQAVDTFMQLTSPSFTIGLTSPLHSSRARQLDLAGPSCDFVNKLEANMGPKSPFPGGSYYC